MADVPVTVVGDVTVPPKLPLVKVMVVLKYTPPKPQTCIISKDAATGSGDRTKQQFNTNTNSNTNSTGTYEG